MIFTSHHKSIDGTSQSWLDFLAQSWRLQPTSVAKVHGEDAFDTQDLTRYVPVFFQKLAMRAINHQDMECEHGETNW
jgi:hypothetical protein